MTLTSTPMPAPLRLVSLLVLGVSGAAASDWFKPKGVIGGAKFPPPPTPAAWASDECKPIIDLVQAGCADMKGGGNYCVRPCQDAVNKAAVDADINIYQCNDRRGWKNYVSSVWCWGGKHQINVHGTLKWKPNCVPVMDFYCGRYKGEVFHNARNTEKYDACDVCVNYYFWGDPQIFEFGCWMSQLRLHKFCKQHAKPGLTRFTQSKMNDIHEKIRWLKPIPRPNDIRAYWDKPVSGLRPHIISYCGHPLYVCNLTSHRKSTRATRAARQRAMKRQGSRFGILETTQQ